MGEHQAAASWQDFKLGDTQVGDQGCMHSQGEGWGGVGGLASARGMRRVKNGGAIGGGSQ